MESPTGSRGRRAYDSSGRQAQARLTRARIRTAAAALFTEQGYAGTSVGTVAREAGVAPQTVYAVFGSKAGLLKEVVEVSLAGDDEPVAVFDRPAAREVLDAATADEAAAAMAALCRHILERAGALIQTATVAAADDPEIAEQARRGAEGRLLDMRRTVQALARKGFLRDGVPTAEAVDHVWALTSADVYLACVRERGWTPARYERWLRAALALVIG